MAVPSQIGQRKTYRRDGFALRYWEAGSGERVLYLHGAGLPAATFRENIRSLSHAAHVVVPDIPGFGNSDFPGRHWGFAEYADLFQRFLEDTGFAPTRMIGYSFGGGIALHLAPRVPSLHSLVLLSPSAMPVGYAEAGIVARIFGEAWSGLREAVRLGSFAIFLRIVRDFAGNGMRWILGQQRILGILARGFQRSYDFSGITVPTLVVSVRGDRFFPPALGEALARTIPSARWIARDGTHLWALIDHENAARFMSATGMDAD
jgi:pimeloyl-ACP methyl ester carboxylesterase